MGLISFETLFETILLTIFLVLAKVRLFDFKIQGWGIIRFYVMREEATHVTVALGTVYLHYSAFFVTIEISFLNRIVKVSNYNTITTTISDSNIHKSIFFLDKIHQNV